MSFISLRNVSKTYTRGAETVEALSDVSLDAEFGEFVCLLGVSGCGKSTLLQVLAGHEPASGGDVLFDGARLTEPHRESAQVFQDHGLFPWMDVERNVGFNLRARGADRRAQRETVARMIETVGLNGFEKRYPHELSGGMRQRVGIARALTTAPKLLLMDEPFGALDAQTRSLMQAELLRVWERHRATVIFVTHSIEEAVILADRIVVMTPRPGRVRAEIRIDLPRPRRITDPAFVAHVEHALGELHDDLSLLLK